MPLGSISRVVSKIAIPPIPSVCAKINNQFCSYSISFKMFIYINYSISSNGTSIKIVQVLVIFGIRGTEFSTAMTFFVLQYLLRVIRTYFVFTEAIEGSGVIADATWVIFAFYVLLYLQSGHVSSRCHHFTYIFLGKLQFFHPTDGKIFKFTIFISEVFKNTIFIFKFWNQKSVNYDSHYFVI